MKKLLFISLIFILGTILFSCTAGIYDGAGGEENLTIIDRTTTHELKGKYVWVTGTKGPLTITFAGLRPKVENNKASSPMSKSVGIPYTGSDAFASGEFTVTIYDDRTTASPSATVSPNPRSIAVTFYDGSAVIDWK